MHLNNEKENGCQDFLELKAEDPLHHLACVASNSPAPHVLYELCYHAVHAEICCSHLLL